MQYTVSILDSDTMIERRVIIEATDAYEAHKLGMMREILDFEVECVSKIVDDTKTTVYLKDQGFYEAN